MRLAVIHEDADERCEEFVNGTECRLPAVLQDLHAEGPESKFYCILHNPEIARIS